MSVSWTTEQQQVIDLRDRNILVSAAAGSGKTAVLVERILKRLTDPVRPVDVDHLLVVTFTKAAAAEMKERIRESLEKLMESGETDERILRQATLVHSAQITTIDSFCQSVIRDHFHRIDLDPGFRVAEEGELTLLMQDVMEEFLEEKYAEKSEAFLRFVEAYATGRDDKKLEEMILKLYSYSRSYPDPEGYLETCRASYRLEEDGQLPLELQRQVCEDVKRRLEDLDRMLDEAREIAGEADGPFMYDEMLEKDQMLLQKLLDAAEEEQPLSAMYQASEGIRTKKGFQALSRKKSDQVDPEKRELVKEIRDQVKKLAVEICKDYFYESPEEQAQELSNCQEPMEVMTELVREFGQKFAEAKADRNLIDFGDMEQFALKILAEKQADGTWKPTQAAEEYQERFEEIMIDEYQDSNMLQETILTSVSRAGRGQQNMFMVGDVKQSIYRFRLSRPDLFMDKFDRYTLEESENQRIDLHKNFRSRAEVLEGVNFVFRQIMHKDLGGVEYDDRAALYPGAKFPEIPKQSDADNSDFDFASGRADLEAKKIGRIESDSFNSDCELILNDIGKEEKESLNLEETDRELEAKTVAIRIRQLLAEGLVLDKETGEYRRPSYKDIVILTRSVRGWADIFSEVLKEEGIPVYAGKTEGYFETYEVALLLDYLKILDNPRQDLAMTAVLTSPLCGMNSEQLAQIRNAFPEVPFYEAVQACAEEAFSEERTGEVEVPADFPEKETKESLKKLWKDFKYFREKVPYTAIYDLLWEILNRTGYYHLMSVMPGGEQRQANLDMLLNQAAAFEQTSYKGLFHFVRYIEQLKRYEIDYGEASVTDEQMDAVRLMSIHKSKGLEFPIVFVCGMSKRFNRQDSMGAVVLHPELGVGIDSVDLEQRMKTVTLQKKIIQHAVNLENLGEELRILYVAMTRAKEKLILTGSLANAEEKMNKESGATTFSARYKANSYLDWLLMALKNREEKTPFSIRIRKIEEMATETAQVAVAESMAREELLQWKPGKETPSDWMKETIRQMEYQYPYKDAQQMKLKFTVSELKKRDYLEEEAGEILVEEKEVVPLIPEFMQESTGLSGASRGSAYHKLLELLDYRQAYSMDQLKDTIERLVEEEKMSQEMEDCIRRTDILHFLECGLGQRMHQAAKADALRKEQPFVLGVPSQEVYPEQTEEEWILVQGIIDVFFEETDGLVLLDYKTDRVKTGEELVERYHTQLEYYGQALEQLLGKKVKETWIYSFALGKEIRLG